MPIRKIPERIIEVPYSDNIITEIDSWQLTNTISGMPAGENVITSNWSRVSDTSVKLPVTKKGTGLTESSGVFSFPSTGYYNICYWAYITAGATGSTYNYIDITDDNSNYTMMYFSLNRTGAETYKHDVEAIIKVTDISNDKFRLGVAAAGSVQVVGQPARFDTGFYCLKIGEI